MLTIGIDIGSVTTKGVLMSDGALLSVKSCLTGYNAERAARTIYGELLENENLRETSVNVIVATGYGRNSVPFADKTLTEIMCHAVGAPI
jgi:activator of 2-hydroxyglutaryl-CoA dehydratase